MGAWIGVGLGVYVAGALSMGILTGCSSSSSNNNAGSGDDDDSCTPTDENGVTGMDMGTEPFEVSVSDTGFGVGGPDSGSIQNNITVENFASVSITLTNIGTKPHGMVVQCLATPNTKGCAPQSCFPDASAIPEVDPGASKTVTFTTPIVEGSYTFVSPQAGDTTTLADGGVTGIVGYFNLM
jgi:hypothetical protein